MKNKEEKINLYCKDYIAWIRKKYEIGEDIFIYYNLKYFYLVCNIIRESLENLKFEDELSWNINYFNKIDFFSKVNIVKKFFKDINMNVNIEKCLQDGTISPFYIDFKGSNIKEYMKGHGQVDNNKNGEVMFPNSGFLLDIVIMMHELGHYANKPINNQQVSLISEAIALYTELKSYDYLSSLGYDEEVKFFKNFRFKNMYKDAERYTNSISLLLTYINFGNITKENFYKLFPQKNYSDILDAIKGSEDFYSIFKGMNYMFGLLMASYLYENVKEDFSFTENINILNKNLNNSNFYEILKILGIKSFDEDSIYKLSFSIRKYINDDNYLVK